MERELEEGEAKNLLEEIGWQSLMPGETEVKESPHLNHDFSVSVKETQTNQGENVYRVSAKYGQRGYFKSFPEGTGAWNYIEENLA